MKHRLTGILFVIVLLTLFMANILTPDDEYSISERRKLASFPSLSIGSLMDKSFTEKFEKYTLDQFILRQQFRAVKAFTNYKVLRKIDNNGIVLKDGYIFKSDYPTNTGSAENFTSKINSVINIINTSESNCRLYYSIIPDKNYYIGTNDFLSLDYDYIYSQASKINAEQIELRDILALSDYYETDTHWRQEKIMKVAKRLGESMGFNPDSDFTEKEITGFYGVYYSQAAIIREPETIKYLTNDVIDSCMVYYLEDENEKRMYTPDKANSFDKYDVFLSGASSFIKIENPKATGERELILFRDSFSSSLAPLLVGSYKSVTLVDLRYITSENYMKLIDFEDKDILFLYSTLLVNNSAGLKK